MSFPHTPLFPLSPSTYQPPSSLPPSASLLLFLLQGQQGLAGDLLRLLVVCHLAVLVLLLAGGWVRKVEGRAGQGDYGGVGEVER